LFLFVYFDYVRVRQLLSQQVVLMLKLLGSSRRLLLVVLS